MKRCHVLVALDAFTPAHLQKVAAVLEGWATWERIAQAAPAGIFAASLARADVLVGWAPPSLLPASALTAYLCGSAGLDAYVGLGLEERADFQICNAAGTMTRPIAEHLLGLMLALTRQLPQILRNQSRRCWERRWVARELNGSTVCIVGLGGSGSELAARCHALGLHVTGVRRHAARPHPHARTVWPVARLTEAVRTADHVVAVVPGGPATRHLFNSAVFAAMKPGACFYTASRGSVTDEDALIAHLCSGHLGGAGLDVYAVEPLPATSPLWAMENVIVSPHSAGLSDRLPDRLCELMCANLARYHRSEPLLNRVDLATFFPHP